MGILRGLTKNWANTTEPTHSDLAPMKIDRSADDVRLLIHSVVTARRNWTIESREGDELHLVRSTRLGWQDDVRLQLHATDTGTLIHAESRSRAGKGDLGQNRRNILELWSALRKQLS